MQRPPDATDLTSLGWPSRNTDGQDPRGCNGKYELNLFELLRGAPVRLRYVPRYSTCRVNHKETVAEHSFYVVLYAALIGQWLQNNPLLVSSTTDKPQYLTHRLNWELLMVRAVVHDLEESHTGDCPRHFKYMNEALRVAHEEAAVKAFELVCRKLVSAEWAERLKNNWLLAKDSRLEGRVIAFADYLSVLAFIAQEYESGNRNAFEHAETLRAYYSHFEDSAFDALRPLIDQVPQFIDYIFNSKETSNVR